MFGTVPLSIIRSFSLYTQQAVSKHLGHIPLLCVQWKTPDDGQRNCPKHVELYSKNKFEKLVHLIGFIVGIYHDARSPERQITACIRSIILQSWLVRTRRELQPSDSPFCNLGLFLDEIVCLFNVHNYAISVVFFTVKPRCLSYTTFQSLRVRRWI